MEEDDILKKAEEIRRSGLEGARGRFSKKRLVSDAQESAQKSTEVKNENDEGMDSPVSEEIKTTTEQTLESNINHGDTKFETQEQAERSDAGENNVEQKKEIQANPSIFEIREEIAVLEKEVEQNRRDYLEMDYKKNAALKRIRKYFFTENTFRGNLKENANNYTDANLNTDTKKYSKDQTKSLEGDIEIAAFRAYYDNSLIKLRDAKIQEAELRGAGDKELSEIFASFMFEQKLKVQEIHDDVRAEHFDGKAFGFVREAMLDLSKEYRSMSFKKKFAIGVAFAGTGLAVTHLAGAAAVSTGAIAAMMAAKRTIIGSLVGVGTAEGLAAKNKLKKENRIEQDRRDFEKLLDGMTEDKKYEFLLKKTWEISIKDEKNAINEIKNKNLEHLAAGTLVGSILSTGLMGQLLKIGGEYINETSLGKLLASEFKDVKDFFEGSDVSKSASTALDAHNSDGSKLPPFPKTGIFADDSDKFNNATPSGAPSPTEQAAHIKEMVGSHDTELRIEKGSSIERTLIDHIKKIHPDIKNPGHAAHRMWLDYMHENKNEIIAKVGDTEYHKMLKDGMVNVKPGTILAIDEHDPLKLKLHDIGGKITHLNGGHGHVEITHPDQNGVDSSKNLTPTPDDNLGNVPKENTAELPRDTVTDYSRLETELQTEDAIDEMDQKHHEAVGEALIHTGQDGPSLDQFEKMRTFDQARNDFRVLLREMRAQDMPWLGETNIETLIKKGAESKQVLRICLNNLTEGHISKSGYWSEIKNQPVMRVAFENGKMNERFASIVKQFQEIKGIGNRALPVNENETTGQWIARLTKLALSRRDNI